MNEENKLINRNKIIEPNELLKKIFSKFTKEDIIAILTVLIVGLINNFNFFISEGFAPDNLSEGNFSISDNWEISLGRFGIVFVNLLRYGLVNKFIIVLISLFFLSISAMFISRIFNLKNKILVFLISALIAVAPQFTEIYMFIYCADAYCLAFLLSILSGYFLKKSEKNRRFYVFALICIILECSIYQAYLGVTIGIAIILLIKDLLDNKAVIEVIKKGFKFVVIIMVSIILYYIILKIILSILGISLSSYKGANNLGIENLKKLPKSIVQTFRDYFDFFFSNRIISNSYWKRKYIYLGIYILSFLGIILIFIKNKFKAKGLRFFCILFLLSIFPIGVNIINIIAPMTSINLVTGVGIITSYILVFLIYDKLINNWLENLIKYAYIVLLCILIFTFILENTFTYMCRLETFRNYYAVTSNIYQQVVSLDGYSPDMKWMFSNVIKYKAKNRDRANGFISDNNETWDNYNGTHQNKNFFSRYYGININICSKSEYDSIVQTEEFKNMPVYPSKGSIKIINNIIVIKVSDKVLD